MPLANDLLEQAYHLANRESLPAFEGRFHLVDYLDDFNASPLLRDIIIGRVPMFLRLIKRERYCR